VIVNPNDRPPSPFPNIFQRGIVIDELHLNNIVVVHDLEKPPVAALAAQDDVVSVRSPPGPSNSDRVRCSSIDL